MPPTENPWTEQKDPGLALSIKAGRYEYLRGASSRGIMWWCCCWIWTRMRLLRSSGRRVLQEYKSGVLSCILGEMRRFARAVCHYIVRWGEISRFCRGVSWWYTCEVSFVEYRQLMRIWVYSALAPPPPPPSASWHHRGSRGEDITGDIDLFSIFSRT